MTRDELCKAAWSELQKFAAGEVPLEWIAGDILEGKAEYQTISGWKFGVYHDGEVQYSRPILLPLT